MATVIDEKADVARRYVRDHDEREPGFRAAYYLPTGAPKREIRVLAVHETALEFTDNPLRVPHLGIRVGGRSKPYKVMACDITPAQWERVQSGELGLPAGWSLDDHQQLAHGSSPPPPAHVFKTAEREAEIAKVADAKERQGRLYALDHEEMSQSIRAIYYLPTDAPAREIRLIEVYDRPWENKDNPIIALDYGLDVGQGPDAYKLLVGDITPAQWDRVRRGDLGLPAGWTLDGYVTFFPYETP